MEMSELYYLVEFVRNMCYGGDRMNGGFQVKINSITVAGFKNIKKTKLELDNICALISTNNYGKSNLMEAIAFGFDFIHESRKSRKSMMSWIKGIPLCTVMQDDEYLFEVEFFDENLGDYKYVKYGFSFKWHRDDESGEVITGEWIEARENTSVRYNSFLKRNEGKYRKGKDTVAFRKIELDEDEMEVIKSFNLITLKPIIYVANVSEEDILNGGNSYYEAVKEYAKKENSEVVLICAKIESELAELNDTDKTLFLKDLGIEESGLDQLIKKTYSLLGLATFFTAGSDEVKAWTFKKGMKAPQCAGIIHSDFERGFIRAEIMSYDDFCKYGSEKEVKENGKMRLEGKDYLMQDGDICYFRFNV